MLLEAEKNGTLETLARGIPMEELPELIEWVMEKIQSPDYPLDLSEMIIHDYLIREFNCRSDEPYGAWRLNHGNKKEDSLNKSRETESTPSLSPHSPMNKYIRIVRADRSCAESEFDKLAAEGWSLVACWPEGNIIQGVFQRSRSAVFGQIFSPVKDLVQAIPGGPDLESVLQAVICNPPKKPGYPNSLSVPTLAKQHHSQTPAMLAHLRHLGLQSKEENPEDYVTVFKESYNLFLKKGRFGVYYINAQSIEDFKKSPKKRKEPPRAKNS